MLGLPFVFVIFIISFPAGLLVYWITTNVWTIVQQTDRAQDRRRPMTAARWRAAGAPAGASCAGGGWREAVDRGRSGAPLGRRGREERGRSPPPGRATPTAHRPRPTAVAQKEEALGSAAMSAARDASKLPPRVRRMLEEIVDAARRRRCDRGVRGRGRGARDTWTARTSGCLSAATARRSTRCSTSPTASRTGRPRRSASASWSTPRATASAAPRRCSARPTRPRGRRCATGEPVALDAMSADRAPRRPRVPARPRGVETYSEGDEPDRHLVVAPRRLA